MTSFADYGIHIPPGRSGEVRTICPQCAHRRKREHQREKDLAVNTETGTWYCHHCGWKDGLKQQTDWRERIPRQKPYTKPDPEKVINPDEAICDWFLRERHIPEEVVLDAQIGGGLDFCPACGDAVRAIRFPYFRGGELVHVKYRCGKKHFWSSKDTERIVYNLDSITDADLFVIVEGEIDALSVMTAGFPHVVSVPDGAPNADAQNVDNRMTFLLSMEAQVKRATKILIATDMDANGERLAQELASRIHPRKCWRVRWPEGCKDANETLVKHGGDAVLLALDQARAWPVAGIIEVADKESAVRELYRTGFDAGVSVGWPAFDAHCHAKRGLLNVVTGCPGSGKSTWLDNWLVRLAVQHDWVFALYSAEAMPIERHMGSLMSIYTGLPFNDGPTPRMSEADLDRALVWLDDHFVWMYPDEPKVSTIIELAETLRYRRGISGLVIDPWNELDHTRASNVQMHEHVTSCLRDLRRYANESEVAVWLVAHPTKLKKNDETGWYPVATPYDIADSAGFFNRPDFCLSVWRNPNEPSTPTEVHIQKVRFQETGQVGMVHFRYDKAINTVREMGQPLPQRMETAPWDH